MKAIVYRKHQPKNIFGVDTAISAAPRICISCCRRLPKPIYENNQYKVRCVCGDVWIWGYDPNQEELDPCYYRTHIYELWQPTSIRGNKLSP